MSARAARLMAAALALGALAGCGATTQVREPDIVVSGATPQPAEDARTQRSDNRISIAVVTHGQAAAADTFWTIVRNGVDAAERRMDVDVDYQSPDVFDPDTMSDLIDAAVARGPDALVVSIPTGALAPALRRAVAAGIPVVSINSGSDVSRRLGTLAHVGQPEEDAGYQAGRRLIGVGATEVVCVNHEQGNDGLDRRCAGLARALREAGGSSRVLAVDDRDDPETRARVIDAARGGVDALLTLNAGVAEVAVESVPRDVRIATFDYTPSVLESIADGRVLFAVDQQPYLQGFLPIVLLAEYARYGLLPAQGRVIPTGPSFVTRDNAAQVQRLSRLGIR